MKHYISLLLVSILFSADFDYNASIITNFGDNYDFYSYAENQLNLNLFYKDIEAWVQYEYSNPPEIGFTMNDIRKFRIEYSQDDYTVKLGDIYEIWGRGLVLNQFDDQSTNFDNGIRGLFLGYEKGPLTLNHISGNAEIWNFGPDLRTPYYNNSHNVIANHIQYDWASYSLGVSQLLSKEVHQKVFGSDAYVNHSLKGIHGSWTLNNADIYLEYVDKISTEKLNLLYDGPHDSLKTGHGFYGNMNFYFGNFGLSTEYKRMAFDVGHSDFTADDYGNRIAFQAMPTLGREQNSTLLGRVAHQFNFNDERGVQISLNGTLLNVNIVSQYAHLSRNEEWQSLTLFNWINSSIEGYLPSSDPSALPYWENYHEINGYHLNDKLYFKLGRGENKDILKTLRYFEGEGISVNETWIHTDSTEWQDDWVYLDSSLVGVDTFVYKVESKMWQVSKAITYPLELSYSFNNGYNLAINFEYQEQTKQNISKGNSKLYSTSDSSWTLINPDNPDSFFVQKDNLFSYGTKQIDTQINRLVSLTIGNASKWSITFTHDQTNAFSGPTTIDPFYNPLEAFIYGDLKYFTGKRNKIDPPGFIQNRWVSMEVAYNLTSSQRISILYGSLQGGLYCSNGVCRQIAPFNDGIKLSYSAIF
jgi:hypothetical protein